MISLLTEVFKLYFSSSSLITKLVVIPINRKTETLIKELLNRKSRVQILIKGKEKSNMYLLVFTVYSLSKNKIKPRIAHATILVKDKIPLAPELN